MMVYTDTEQGMSMVLLPVPSISVTKKTTFHKTLKEM